MLLAWEHSFAWIFPKSRLTLEFYYTTKNISLVRRMGQAMIGHTNKQTDITTVYRCMLLLNFLLVN